MSTQPHDGPPSYQIATSTGGTTASNTLKVPTQEHRRSMEDENRSLPPGWVRQFDSKENHQFFVDTRANPPRSIWHHPYDDDEYLRSLSAEERERIQEEERQRMYTNHSDDDLATKYPPEKQSHVVSAASSTGSSAIPQNLPPRPDNTHHDSRTQKVGLGDKLKEKLTGHTREERARERQLREQEELQYAEAHMKFRAAMQRAMQTGQPQWLAKDRDGRDVYVEPPNYGYNAYGAGAYGYNPYTAGPYSNPNARYIRPPYGYARPGYGGSGYGMPIAGGLLGGMLLGGLLF